MEHAREKMTMKKALCFQLEIMLLYLKMLQVLKLDFQRLQTPRQPFSHLERTLKLSSSNGLGAQQNCFNIPVFQIFAH